MTFQISDEEAKLIFELFGSMSKTKIDFALYGHATKEELDETSSYLERESKKLAMFKMIDVVYDRLQKVYNK